MKEFDCFRELGCSFVQFSGNCRLFQDIQAIKIFYLSEHLGDNLFTLGSVGWKCKTSVETKHVMANDSKLCNSFNTMTTRWNTKKLLDSSQNQSSLFANPVPSTFIEQSCRSWVGFCIIQSPLQKSNMRLPPYLLLPILHCVGDTWERGH